MNYTGIESGFMERFKKPVIYTRVKMAYENLPDPHFRYLDELADALFRRVGKEEGRRRIQEHLIDTKIGDTEECVSIYTVAEYLNETLGKRERKAVTAHVPYCDGCSAVVTDVVRQEMEAGRIDTIPTYVLDLVLARREYEQAQVVR